eukprot:gene6278-6517_t
MLLTGSSGYVGALTLEKLLRSTDVQRIYVLLRAKRGESAQARLAKQLQQSAIMHLLRDNPVLDKVVAITGDMMLPELGININDRRTLQREVNTVIHCAADIRLEAGIQQLLTANYEGTRQLLKLAASFDNLTAFVHVSSAYTNMNAPSGSLVKEAIYPLTYGDQPVDDYELVQELLSQPAHNANSRSECLMKHWNFPNNYTLSKHLAEYMVADFHKSYKLPVAIVRPTLISSVAKDPYPGYTGNFAGHVGATLAFMAGLFDSPAASNYKGGNVWDVIPADVVIADILAAAAAVGAGMSSQCCATRTRNGRLVTEAEQIGTTLSKWTTAGKPPSSAKAAAAAAGAASGKRRTINVSAFSTVQAQSVVDLEAQDDDEDQLLIIHCGSSTLYPLTIMESWNWGVEVYGAWKTAYKLSRGCAGPLTVDHQPDPVKAAAHINWTGCKVRAVAAILSAVGEERVAKKLLVGFDSFKLLNQPKTDVNLRFSTQNTQGIFKMGIKVGVVATSEVGSSTASTGEDSLPASGSCSDAELHGSDGEECSSSGSSSPLLNKPKVQRGAVLAPEQVEAVARMKAVPHRWRDFHVNSGAFLYCTVFKMPEPEALLPVSNVQVIKWLNIKPEDRWVRHQFKLYK